MDFFLLTFFVPPLLVLYYTTLVHFFSIDPKRESHNVYAKTSEECKEALAMMIAEKKAEIAAEKVKMKTA